MRRNYLFLLHLFVLSLGLCFGLSAGLVGCGGTTDDDDSADDDDDDDDTTGDDDDAVGDDDDTTGDDDDDSSADDDDDSSSDDDDSDGSVDGDQDGVPASEDCDDSDVSLGAIAEDADCDGVLTDDDCADDNPSVGQGDCTRLLECADYTADCEAACGSEPVCEARCGDSQSVCAATALSFPLNLVVITDDGAAATEAQLREEVHILNEFFRVEDGSAIVHFRYGQHALWVDVSGSSCDLVGMVGAGTAWISDEWAAAINACSDTAVVSPSMVNFLVYDDYTESAGYSSVTSRGRVNQNHPYVLIDIDRLNHTLQSPEEHEMGHAFGLNHVCDPTATASSSTNIMASGSDCSGRGGLRDIGFDSGQLSTILQTAADSASELGLPGSVPPVLQCPANDSFEDNDSMAAAYDLGGLPQGTSTFDGILCPGDGGDVDWFRFSAQSIVSRCYSVFVSSGASAGVAVELTNQAGNTLESGTTSPATPVTFPDRSTPVYHHKIGMTRAGASTTLNRRYTLEITMKPAVSCP
jgi:hypothetical protein